VYFVKTLSYYVLKAIICGIIIYEKNK